MAVSNRIFFINKMSVIMVRTQARFTIFFFVAWLNIQLGYTISTFMKEMWIFMPLLIL